MLFAALHLANPGENKFGIVTVFIDGMVMYFSLWRKGVYIMESRDSDWPRLLRIESGSTRPESVPWPLDWSKLRTRLLAESGSVGPDPVDCAMISFSGIQTFTTVC